MEIQIFTQERSLKQILFSHFQTRLLNGMYNKIKKGKKWQLTLN